MSYELCDSHHGTRSKVYDAFRCCHNALIEVLQDATVALKFLSRNMYLLMPGKSLVLPIYIDGVFSLQPMPDVKVWAIQTVWTNPFTGSPLVTVNAPLFKDSLEDIWSATVRPLDMQIPDSEFLFYQDEETGDIRQGINFYGEGQNRYFWLLGDGSPLIRDVGAVVLFAYILSALGLTSMISKFIQIVLTNISGFIMKRRVAATAKKINDLHNDVSSFLQIETLSDGEIISLLKGIDSKVGLKLLLR